MNKYSLVQSILVLITVLAVASMNTVNTNSSPETIIKCMDITTPGYYYLSSNITGIQESRRDALVSSLTTWF